MAVCMSKQDKIRNDYIKGNLDVTNKGGKMRENRLIQFCHVKIKNNEGIVKKIGEIRVKGNREIG